MKLTKKQKIIKRHSFFLNVRIHPYTKPFITVHQPSLKHSVIPQSSQSILQDNAIDSFNKPQSFICCETGQSAAASVFLFTHTELDWQILWSSCSWMEWKNREERSIFRWWTALITHRSLEQGHLLWEAHQHLPLWWTGSTCRLTRWGAAWIEEYQSHPQNNAAVL